MSEEGLQFTGERFLPNCEREIWYEHFHRYTMALNWVEDAVVLDAACGEGYGSHLLAQKAQSVVGVDLSEEAIEHAKSNYHQDNLEFICSNVLSLPFDDNCFDVVVSFETLEHLVEHQQLIQEFKRVLKTDGVLLISTPDKKEYSDKTGFKNEYHFKELYQNEFADLLDGAFSHTQWYGQKLMFSSSIWRMDHPVNKVQYDFVDADSKISNVPEFNPLYFIVVASDHEFPRYKDIDFFSFTEHSEQIYGHYNAVIRAHIKAEQDCKKLLEVQHTWLQHPIIGRCIKWFSKD